MTLPILRRTPHLGPNPDYSKAFYPDPPSHDFCVWLIIAELARRHHGAPGPLQVRFGFINGQLGSMDFGPLGIRDGRCWHCAVPKSYHDQMLANVLRPAIQMIGAVELPTLHAPFNDEDIADHVEYDYHIGHLVDAGRQGFEIPQWTIPQWAHAEVANALGDIKPVIITLREVEGHQPERNSRLEEWLRFAHSIKDDYPVLFVRDTGMAHEPLPALGRGSDGPTFATCWRASTNVFVRAALYQRALVNMTTCNGPIIWCIFSDAPYLTFKQLVPALPDWAHGQPIGWREQDHMEVGDQYPWASPLQRFTWMDDTFENISAAFADFLERSRVTPRSALGAGRWNGAAASPAP